VLIVILALFLAILSISAIKEYAHIGDGVYPSTTISVSGTGEVYAMPDIAQFSFTVTEEADSIAEAQQTVTEKIDSAIEILNAEGVEDKDIKTTGYNAYPRYNYPRVVCTETYCPSSERVLSGYEVSQTISVKVRDTEKAGDVLGKVTETGVSNVSSLSFVIDDRSALKDEARAQAIEKAKQKMDGLAKDLGVKTKGIVSFYEYEANDGYAPAYDMALSSRAYGLGGAEESVSATLPTGESLVRVEVNITYEIE